LDTGIAVLSTLNVQHLESLNDVVRDITGVTVRETVPDRLLHEADEVKLVDVTPRALIHRLERGEVYPPSKVDQALHNWFREGNLNALREITLRVTAEEVDEDLTAYRRARHIEEPWAAHDRVMVCVSPTLASLRLVRRGWRLAQRLHGDIVTVYVESKPPEEKEQRALQDCWALAERLGIPVVALHGDVATELIHYARQHDITHIVLGHSTRSRWREMWHGSIINRLTRELRTIDILIVAVSPT
jgi:two-component system sensor histidine kinase KdpD